MTSVYTGRRFCRMDANTTTAPQLEWHVIQVLPSGNETQVALASTREGIDRLYDWLSARHPRRVYYVIREEAS